MHFPFSPCAEDSPPTQPIIQMLCDDAQGRVIFAFSSIVLSLVVTDSFNFFFFKNANTHSIQ